ncbi:hypothetical protein PPL_06482 [Heterostelium album PN500]|uniref:Uncharacterized protein n=1 Tax=Heterostelium pallidum (strain ATCC 26659 / Pp 5 / PN500) TaxID=670386 RepID=D3BDA1_HETP5|nr:hypothetical protein PPL_06482 [Heterostelium album PN500]EFA80545.1 hypothetical protein PPL_06482 [Heterostelium album PN500]|eukprot:XP_020432665.1 hypothetical protein PPL_06482 [Heterostelium album PN500]
MTTKIQEEAIKEPLASDNTQYQNQPYSTGVISTLGYQTTTSYPYNTGQTTLTTNAYDYTGGQQYMTTGYNNGQISGNIYGNVGNNGYPYDGQYTSTGNLYGNNDGGIYQTSGYQSYGGNPMNGNFYGGNGTGSILVSNGRNLLDSSRGEYLQSNDQIFKLVMQNDGNLVLKRFDHPIDATHTWHKGSKPYRAIIENDGYFRIRDKNGKATFTKGRPGQGPYRLVLQDDSRVILYDANGQSTVIL